MHLTPRRALVAASLIAGSLALIGCGEPNAAQNAAHPDPVVGVVTVSGQSLPMTTELAGRTSPYQVSDVRPQVGGIIQKRLFTEGSEIKAGQVLYQIDPATYQAAYDSAKASLAKAEANVLSAKNRADRYADLVKINAVSKQDYDDAFATLKQSEADVAAGRAAVESARINLAYTKVTSPVDGRIGRSSVTPGALVTANQAESLATVQTLDPIYVDVTQSSNELLRLQRELASGSLKRAGTDAAKVRLVFDDGTTYPLEGKLEFSEVTVEQSTGTVTLRAVFPNPKHQLLPGMYVRAVIEEGVNDNAILAPQQAVTRDARGQATAMVVGKDDKVEPRMLKTARTVGDNWLVTDGLKSGDKLIVDGLQKIHPGAKVKTVAASGAASAPTVAAK
ncbi:efflux RND transporter periplasmic adaptor subunit [Jeongeupia naejangsanensis]|uniref:Efflux RND transporter periplasmic adaptor subunit n=1 Tax=Jeongeupia naejangsanensis TaxID=613195 RepID=A0ABS2BQJ6_9NEIS|nr:efflux RND transporter periplasmic adaptor subunit [Jeongeupia naejangsanensis]MBM3117914.1 efflux RND transporter periplasmic adaptor subunit [Jeongeupia naejangsanensis]